MKKLISLLLTIPFLFCSCIFVVDPDLFEYEKDEKYTSGEKNFSTNDYPIDHFVINWVNGSIKINYHDDNTIVLHEEANRSLSKETKLHWNFNEDNNLLTIQYCQSKAKLPEKLRKDLVLTLPRTLQTQKITLNSVNAKINCDNIFVEDFQCDDVNGGGNISFSNTLKFLSLNNVNSDYKITAPGVTECNFDSTNGNVSLTTTESAPKKISSSTVKGNCKLYIPENDGFAVEFDTITGKFTCADFKTSISENTYIYNSNAGNRSYKFTSVSGDLEISKYVASN